MEVHAPAKAPTRAPDEGIRFEEHAELPENDCVDDEKIPAFDEFKLAMENMERLDLVNIIEEVFEKSTKKTQAILGLALDVKSYKPAQSQHPNLRSKDEEICTDLGNLNYTAPVNLGDLPGETTDSGGDEDDSDAGGYSFM
ncbi:hypothetical protein AAMO2058_001092400 [Amorphochlora amoebiformis]